MSVAKLELRIDLGPSVVGQTEEAIRKASEHSSAVKQLSPYALQQKKIRAHTTGANKPRDPSYVEMPGKEDGEAVEGDQRPAEEGKKKPEKEKKPRRKRVKVKKEKTPAPPAAEMDDSPKPILRQKDTPPTGSRVVIKENGSKTQANETNRETPGMTLPTPLRGDANSPLKPYKLKGGRQGLRNTLLRLTTPGTAPISTRMEDRKVQLDTQSGTKALKELLDAIAMGTRMLEFKDMLQVKVNVGIANHIPKAALESLSTFRQIVDELSLMWKINRLDVELLEYLLNKIGMLDRFVADIEKYKNAVGYAELPASSEREATTIISSLHNILQGADGSGGNYTTMCFLHYGDVYSFTRPRLSCLKKDLSNLLSIHHTQITYIAKVAANGNGYVTVFQMPCSVSRKLVIFAKKNNETLMSLGLKGVQITGSDGLRYTQSLGYLQEKISAGTQTSVDDTRTTSRLTRTAPSGSTLPPLGRRQGFQLIRPDLRAKKSAASSRQSRTPPSGGFTGEEMLVGATPSPIKVDLSLNPPADPYEAKFERRIRLVKSTINELSKPETDDLAAVLLEQIRGLHLNISSLKKDLREKSRELNTSQGFVKQAQKEMKHMEMRLETKAQQISQTNEQLIKKIKTLMNENVRLSNALHRMDAELDVHRQLEKESRFGNMIRAVRVTTSEPTAAI